MPIIPRQLGIGSLISEAIQSRLSTASVGLVGASTSVAVITRAPVLSSTAAVPTLSTTPRTSTVNSPAASSTLAVVSQTPTVSATTLTTTTSTPLTSTTQAVTSSSEIPSSSVPSLTLAPAVSSSGVSTASTTSRTAITPSVSATGAAANSGSNAQDSNNMSGGIIALIVVGALLAALLAGALIFRRVQVYRRTKRRENNYGAGPIPDAPFPFTNVSETDLKGAQSIRGFRRGSIISQNEKPLPSIVPDQYPAPVNANPAFGQPAFGNNGMGAYPAMGAAAGYGYGPNRTASPAPSQVPRMMSPAPPALAPYRPASPAPVNAPYPNPYPQAPPPAPSMLAPGSLAVPQVSGKKRVIQTFQPSLPDELDIRDGDWVTVLHAYDDGWGLCECNGRRGVVPLECLDLGKPDFRASRRLSSLSALRQ